MKGVAYRIDATGQPIFTNDCFDADGTLRDGCALMVPFTTGATMTDAASPSPSALAWSDAVFKAAGVPLKADAKAERHEVTDAAPQAWDAALRRHNAMLRRDWR